MSKHLDIKTPQDTLPTGSSKRAHALLDYLNELATHCDDVLSKATKPSIYPLEPLDQPHRNTESLKPNQND